MSRFKETTPGPADWPRPTQRKRTGRWPPSQRAQQVVRRLKQQSGRTTPIVVAIRGGTYFSSQPLHFGPEDSGTAHAPIVYRAYASERPVLSGGVQLDGWQVTPDGRWHAHLADVKAGKWSFTQLFVNDQRRFRPPAPARLLYDRQRHSADGKGRPQVE